MTITVSIAAATLCMAGVCHPALVGAQTPVGQFRFWKVPVADPLYHGSVAAFAQDARGGTYAIHQVWLGAEPTQHRAWRIAHGTAAERVISKGCINVTAGVYAQLPAHGRLRIEP